MKFHMRRNRADNQYSFELVSDEGRPLLTSSRAYADRDGCTEAIQTAIRGFLNQDRFDSRAEDDDFFFVLRTADEQELARSPSFRSQQEVDEAIAFITSAAANTDEYEVTVTRSRKRSVALVERYDFSQRSTSGKPGFELFWSDKNRAYYFHFNDAQGQAFLFSWAFSTIAKRTERIQSVSKNASVETRYERKEQDGRYFFILKARNGREIARSRLFVTVEEMEAALAYLASHAAAYGAPFAKSQGAGIRTGTKRYNLARRSVSGAVGFEVFRNDTDRRYYFHCNGENGRALLYSRAYATRASRDNGLRAVIKNAGSEAHYEAREEEGRYYFILRAGNRRELARSPYFVSAAERAAAIVFLRKAVPSYAAAYGVTLGAAGTAQRETFRLSAARPSASGTLAAAEPARAATVPPRSGNGDGRVRHWLLRLSPLLLVLLLFFVIRGVDGCEGGSTGTEAFTGGADQEQRERLTGAVETTQDNDATSGAGGSAATPSGVAGDTTATAKAGPGGETPSAETGGDETSVAVGAETPSVQAADPLPLIETEREETLPEAVPAGKTPVTEVRQATPSVEPAVAQARAADQDRPVGRKQPANPAQRAAEDTPAAERQAGTRQRSIAEEPVTDEATLAEVPVQEAGPARFDHSQVSWTLVVASHTEQAAAEAEAEAYRKKMGGYLVDVIEETAGSQKAHYRVVVGQSQTLKAAQRVQQGLGNALPAGAWQLHFTDVIEPPSGAGARASLRPDAATLGFAAGTVEAQIADALSGPTSRLPDMFTMEKVAFPFNSAKLNRGAYQQVINLAKLINSYPDIRIDIYGHSDENENEDAVAPYAEVGSITLSALRARCIYRRLIERGVAAERLGFQGLRATKPLTSAGTARGRQQNRRIELVVSRR